MKIVFLFIPFLALSASLYLLLNLFQQNILPAHVNVAAQSSNVPWSQFQADSQNTGKTSAFVPPNYQVSWAWFDENHIVRNFVSEPYKNITDGFGSGYQFNVIFARQMQPIIADGKAFFGALNGKFYIVDSLTGNNYWSHQTQGPIFSTAAYSQGIAVTTSMDGAIYAFDVAAKTLKWHYQTLAGINASPVIHTNVVYVGSRDGNFYALNLTTGALLWRYQTRVTTETNSFFKQAPILSPAAVSEDGSTVFFGAENMYFYALNTTNGTEKWTPKKLIGTSFLYSWPVVKGDKVIIRTMSSLPGSEWLMEDVLDALPTDPTWTQEKTAINNWLTNNPNQKTMYVFNVNTGIENYQVAMGRVSGDGYPPYPPVIDNQNRAITYWRTKRATFVYDGPCFGTKYCPDISVLDLTTGDRIKLINPLSNAHRIAPELDNGYMMSVGGNYLYLHSHFRGLHSIELSTGKLTRISHHSAKWNGGDWRGWGYQIIYYGNDEQPAQTNTNARPPQIHANPYGYSGTAVATTNGKTLLYVNEALGGGIVAIEQR